MKTQFETKSNRVKAVAFHPTRPWVLASLHNGIIQLWDYRLKFLLDQFDQHQGPVRSVSFHPVQPLFVSGGDDCKIKVWNYKKRTCLFDLLGHADYIRTVQFHPGEMPWILSASDDQTVRIWNWQSRQCIAVLTGHTHYVMCAQFHPTQDLIVSGSLDQSVRVWDMSGLRKKTQKPSVMPTANRTNLMENALAGDLFGGGDVMVKFSLEAHDRGVNWVSFHPTQPLIISASDDRLLKLWRINDSQAWEVDSFRGHFNNVSCAIFHPRYDIIVSDSEDKTLRVWDLTKRSTIHTFRRENDRFWIIAAHPRQNVIAAGHDSGLVLFKLLSERVPVYASGNQFIYVFNNTARAYDVATQREVPVCNLKGAKSGTLSPNPCSISYSAADRALICSYRNENSSRYEMYILPPEGARGGDPVNTYRGPGSGAVMVGRKRFAVLDKDQLHIKDMNNTDVKKCNVSPGTNWVFAGPAVGTVLLKKDESVAIFDIQQRAQTAEVRANHVKHVVWSTAAPKKVALISKNTITICTSKLEVLCTVQEAVNIKSAVWVENDNVLLYTTLSHLKYVIAQNGDNGIVRSVESPMYIATARNNKVFCIDREGNARTIAVNPTEYVFKLALAEKRYSDVIRMVRDANLIGNALVYYLQKRGYPEIALHFARDNKVKFNLALECGNIDIALEVASEINDPKYWEKLAQAALAQGNHQIVEMCYQKVRNFSKLSFLYAATGNVDKLRRMAKIAEARQDIQGLFHNALYLGDAATRAKALDMAGLPQLAYLTAMNNGLTDESDVYARKTVEMCPEAELPGANPTATALLPPIPIMRNDESWPLLTVSKGWTDALNAAVAEEGSQSGAVPVTSSAFAMQVDDAEMDDMEDNGAWGDEPEADPFGGSEGGLEMPTEQLEGEGWDMDDGALAELDNIELPTGKGKATGAKFYQPPYPGQKHENVWMSNSRFAIDNAAAGNPAAAVSLLQKQIGLGNAEPLKEVFETAFNGSVAYAAMMPGAAPVVVPLQRNEDIIQQSNAGRSQGVLPRIAGMGSVSMIGQRLREAYTTFSRGQFAETLSAMHALLIAAMCTTVEDESEAAELAELKGICREYITAIMIELKRREFAAAKADPKRQVELAAYVTHCNLQLPHLVIVLRSSMQQAFNNKNFLTAADLARRLLDLNPKREFAQVAQKICQYAEQNPANANAINYDSRNPFVMCVETLTPIYRGSPAIECPFCGASALPEHAGKICPVCKIAVLGKTDVTGLPVSPK